MSYVDFPQLLVEHILRMKQHDIDYARYALKQYDEQMPWLDLVANVKKAINFDKEKMNV